MKKKILALVSNPKSTAHLNILDEIGDLKEAMKRAEKRDLFTVEWDVVKTQTDLRRHSLDYKPQIIHFCGHGTREGLVLEDEKGQAKIVSNAFVVDLLRNFADRIECVLLNACDSEPLADEIAEHINYAIGMNRPVLDDAAIAFTEGFYDTLGAGESIECAFEVGKNGVLGQASTRNAHNRKLTPVKEDDNLLEIRNQEHLIPVLKQKSPLTPIKQIDEVVKIFVKDPLNEIIKDVQQKDKEACIDFNRRLIVLYNKVKAVRRSLRAAGLTTKFNNIPDRLSEAQANTYKQEMQKLNHAQLELEGLKTEAESLPAFVSINQLKVNIEHMEKYLRKILTEYEETCPILDSGIRIYWNRLKHLNEFTESAKKKTKPFNTQFSDLYHCSIELIKQNSTT